MKPLGSGGFTLQGFWQADYNPAGHYIRAWNGERQGIAIVDCLMNLPLLYLGGRADRISSLEKNCRGTYGDRVKIYSPPRWLL